MAEDTLQPSELGTKKYWDKVYAKEIENYRDHGDVGEIWFGEGTMNRVVKWVSNAVEKKAAILDLGCGNGLLLLKLRRAGFTHLTGVDYSEGAIKLSKDIVLAAEDKHESEIQLEVGNILEIEEGTFSCIAFNRKYHICTDKGTYDAISLDPDNALDKRKIYALNVAKLLSDDGRLILTSCNWTKEELVAQFKEFEVLEEIPTPQFQFGGKKGQRVTTLVMKAKTASADP